MSDLSPSSSASPNSSRGPGSGTSGPLGIRRVAALHVFVRDLERSRDFYVDKLDFQEIAVSTPEFEATHRARASVVQAGGARLVFMEPLGSRGESYRWLQKHPEGVGRVVFDVDNVERTFATIAARGGTSVHGIQRRVVEGGQVAWFDIATAFGDTQFRFVEHIGVTPVMPDLKRLDPPLGGTNRFGFGEIDHVTTNFLTLKPALLWLEQVMGFEQYWEVSFHTQDVSKGNFSGSGLKSVVMWDPHSGFKFANNEPAPPFFEASQIFLFCEDHGGPGVQHVAIQTRDLIGAVNALRGTGVQFMPTPAAYYEQLHEHLTRIGVHSIDEEVQALKNLEILVDGSADHQYLMQIFLKEASQQFGDRTAGPFFLELIQRKGDYGFGAGNFRALFESIERTQKNEGRA
jgi:4-hydroxyphenylpyruvate dioxygenase